MLLYYEKIFSELNVHIASGRPSPDKVAMLLAVMDLIESGHLAENRIEYSEPLIAAFAKRFGDLKTAGGSLEPIHPYLHLYKDGFWHHGIKPGRNASYHQLSTVTSREQVDRHIAFFISENEVEFSREFNDRYCLYRVYDFLSLKRRLFQLPGWVEGHVQLNSVLYRAHIG